MYACEEGVLVEAGFGQSSLSNMYYTFMVLYMSKGLQVLLFVRSCIKIIGINIDLS